MALWPPWPPGATACPDRAKGGSRLHHGRGVLHDQSLSAPRRQMQRGHSCVSAVVPCALMRSGYFAPGPECAGFRLPLLGLTSRLRATSLPGSAGRSAPTIWRRRRRMSRSLANSDACSARPTSNCFFNISSSVWASLTSCSKRRFCSAERLPPTGIANGPPPAGQAGQVFRLTLTSVSSSANSRTTRSNCAIASLVRPVSDSTRPADKRRWRPRGDPCRNARRPANRRQWRPRGSVGFLFVKALLERRGQVIGGGGAGQPHRQRGDRDQESQFRFHAFVPPVCMPRGQRLSRFCIF